MKESERKRDMRYRVFYSNLDGTREQMGEYATRPEARNVAACLRRLGATAVSIRPIKN